VLVSLNYATTFKGAYDDVKAVCNTLKELCRPRVVQYIVDGRVYSVTRDSYWCHIDGALGAAYMPYLKEEFGRHPFGFQFPVHSIAMSGHKWIGAPWPCGIYMTRTKLQIRPPQTVNYIGSSDTTFSGSRNGFSALILWDYLSRNTPEQLTVKANALMEAAKRAVLRLKEAERARQIRGWEPTDLKIQRSSDSLTIHFIQPNKRIVKGYSLSTEKTKENNWAHIFIMEHVIKPIDFSHPENMFQRLATDLAGQYAFVEQEPILQDASAVTSDTFDSTSMVVPLSAW